MGGVVINKRAEDLFDAVMGKKSFIYREKDQLIIIGDQFYFEKINDDRLEKLYNEYENIRLDQEGDRDREIFNNIYEKSIPVSVPKKEEMGRRKEIRKHILGLDNSKLESYEKQIEKYETLYKRYKSQK